MEKGKTVPGRVSVIIPTFNYGHFIADCIKSVIGQEHGDCEIIVVDDGSTDGTASVLEPFSSHINYVYQDNQGLSSARNTGLKHATGEYIQFLDSDDMLGKDALRGRLAFLKANPEHSIAVCRNSLFTRVSRHGHPVTKGRWDLYQSNLALHLCRFNIAPPHAFLLRRRVVDEVGEFDASLSACEDYDFWLRAVIRGFIPQFCPDGEVLYRVHSTSMSANRTHQVRQDAEMHLRLYQSMFVDKTYPTDELIASSLSFLTGAATTIARLQFSNDRSPKLEALKERFREVVRQVEESLATNLTGNELAIRLYTCWFTYQLRKNPDLRRYVAGYNKTDHLISQNLRMSRVLQNLLVSITKMSANGLVAKRLAALTLASKFPGIATRLTTH